MDGTDSVLLYKTSCDECGSSDANCIYSDGHTHCFSCNHHSGGSGSLTTSKRSRRLLGLVDGDYYPLPKRRLTEETCRKWNYQVGEHKGHKVQVANYVDKDQNLVAQKLRNKNKEFIWTGKSGKSMPFGYQLWKAEGKMLVVTEGEIDAMSVSQVQDHKWPVVSISGGAAKEEGVAKVIKEIEKHIDFFLGWEKVIFMFDNDDPGRVSAKAAAATLPPGKAFIASLPLKDANAMLVEGRGSEIIKAIWDAKEYRPDHIVNLSELTEEIKKPITWGLEWPWARMTELTYGRRRSEIHTFGAGPGVGKTDFFLEQISKNASQLHIPSGVIMLETPVAEVGKRLAGKVAGKLFHIPETEYEPEELDAALLELGKQVYMYDSFGSTEWHNIKNIIYHYVQGLGIRDIWLDHLTAIKIKGSNSMETLETIMSDLGGMVKQLDFTLYLVSHLHRPFGNQKPYSEGGPVKLESLHGSSALEKWSSYVWGLERNMMSEDPIIKNQLRVRCLKDRYTGRSTGQSMYLDYDPDTGLMHETDEYVTEENDNPEF